MTEHASRIDPADLAGINEQLRDWAAGRETVRPVSIQRLVIADDAVDALVDEIHGRAGAGRAILVVDRTPMRRGGQDLKAVIEDRIASAVPLTVKRLPEEPTSSAFHATMPAAERLSEEVPEFAVIVSVGSGSVTDVAKYARHLAAEAGRVEQLPMISFPTAASVTAYTSALAVLTIDGVKRTLPARAPDAVICDLRTLADAPAPMTQAGFGDVLARAVAYGDWFLADQLGMADGFSDIPGHLLAHAEQAMIEQAEAVAAAKLDGIRAVIEAILLAGMAMSIVEQTAPVSGWEHVISHYLDLTAAADGREQALHGAQVGVATLVAARAYERAWPALDLDRLLVDADVAAARQVIERDFTGLDSNGRLAAEIWRDVVKKLNRWNDAAEARRRFVNRKHSGELDQILQSYVRASAEVQTALSRANAPQSFTKLTIPIPVKTARAAVLHSHLIRSRFTLGDLLTCGGWLDALSGPALLD